MKEIGSLADISQFLQFRFYQPVYYKVDGSSLPSNIREKLELELQKTLSMI